jgi:hypothetical protein
MYTRCSRCGLKIQTRAEFCPACGNQMGTAPERIEAEEDFYEILGLNPSAPAARIRSALAEAMRVWSSRANNAPQMEDRHKAEKLLRLLEQAESVLLDPASRTSYDERRRAAASRKNTHPLPPFPTNSNSRTRPEAERQDTDTPDAPPVNDGREQPGGVFVHFFGWRRLTGTVLGLDAPYLSKPETTFAGVAAKLVIGLLLIPVFLGALGAVMLFRFTFALLSPRSSGGPGFFSGLLSQVSGFFLVGKLFGPKDQVLVRDFRLRDSTGQEHLVRLRGELTAGNLSVGDEVDVEGYNRRGTLMFRKGLNRRTRSEIVVKYR